MNFCFNFVYWYFLEFEPHRFTINSIIFFFFINLAWIISANIFEAYKIEYHSFKKAILFNNIKTVIFFFFLFLLYFQVLSFNYYTRDQVKYLFVIFFTLLIFWKFSLYYSLLYYRKLGFNYRNVIIIGYSPLGVELKSFFENNPHFGYRFKGFITKQKSDKKDIIGCYDEMENLVKENQINELYIFTTELNKSLNKITSTIISKYPVAIRIVPDLSDFSYRNVEMVNYGMLPILNVQQGPLNYWFNRSVKRFSDIVISSLAIIFVLSWLIPLLFIIDLLTGFNGVFFIQRRSGIDNRVFKVIKFRTMKKNNEADKMQATKNDYRITRFGKFLRKTSIDELPQFLNVLAGNMSVVGPRPHMLSHTDQYKKIASKFMIRHKVKPGITGYAQVRGYRGEIKTNRDIKLRVEQDVFYIENWSIWLDLRIIMLTIINAIKGDEKAY